MSWTDDSSYHDFRNPFNSGYQYADQDNFDDLDDSDDICDFNADDQEDSNDNSDIIDPVYLFNNPLQEYSTQPEKVGKSLSKRESIKDEIYNLEWLDDMPPKYMDPKLKTFIKETLVCQICLKLMETVVELRCQHLLCYWCFEKLKQTPELKCPFCKKSFTQANTQVTQRVKDLNFIIKQLPVACLLCFQRVKNQLQKQEESKNQDQNEVWEGKLSELLDHYMTHDKDSNVNQEPCKNNGFGCKLTFKSDFAKSIHEGTYCQFRWRRCQKCLQIYSYSYYTQHKCENILYAKTLSVEANYSSSVRESSYFDLIIVFGMTFIYDKQNFIKALSMHFEYTPIDSNNPNQLEIRVPNDFIKKNLIEALNNEGFDLFIIQSDQKNSKQILSNSPKNTYASITRQPNLQHFISQDYPFMRIIRELTNNNNNAFSRINVGTFTQTSTFGNYQDKKVFIYGLNYGDKQTAITEVKKHLNTFGTIECVQIFGKGKTGKFYGIVQFQTIQSARAILEKSLSSSRKITVGMFFSCGVDKAKTRL